MGPPTSLTTAPSDTRAPSGADGRPDVTNASDGRTRRGERTRRALAEAMIALLEEGDDSPTARRIAARAGVSLRLVFHHFEDVEALLKTAVVVQAERHWRSVRPVPANLDLPGRVRALVRQRSELYEAIAPVRRAAAAIERNSPTVAAELGRSRLLLRGQLEDTFAPELEGLTPSLRRKVLDAMDTATSFEVWDGLGRMERNAAHARQVVELLVEAALERSRP